jgi:hypothetical protein
MLIDLTSLLNLQRIDLNTAVQMAVQENEVLLIDLHKIDQLDKGMGSDGQDFGDYKNYRYKGRFRPIDLKLKNDFRSAEDLEISNTAVEMIDNDFKLPFLTKRFGQILGWTEQSTEKMGRILEPDVIKNLENQLA